MSQSSPSKPEKRHGLDASGVVLRGKHLDVPLPYPQMIGFAPDRTLDDLPVNARIAAELVGPGPWLKVEEIGKELKGLILVELLQADGAAQIGNKDRGRFVQVHQHSGVLVGLVFRLALERIGLLRFHGEAPVQVDPAKPGLVF